MSGTPKPEKRMIGLIGGMSWESTNVYYRLLNEFYKVPHDPWAQPHVIVDSLDFGQLVRLQQNGDWITSGRVLAESARRLEASGAQIIAIAANTMHINAPEVRNAISVPLIDIRDAITTSVKAKGASSIALLGTKYVIEKDFYSAHIEAAGVHVIKPTLEQTDELQRIIFDELTQGIITDQARETLIAIAQDCRARGSEVVALCCTEFGLLLDEKNCPFPFVDSTTEHVRTLLGLEP
jgi:aspartate racemase